MVGQSEPLRHTPERNGSSETSLSSAIERVLESSQRTLLARMDLLRLEAEEDLSRTVWSLGFIAGGAIFAVAGWFILMVLAVRWLDLQLSLGASLGIVGALNAALGSALLGVGIQSLRRIRLMRPDEEPETRTPAGKSSP